jgi:hypothetical protein
MTGIAPVGGSLATTGQTPTRRRPGFEQLDIIMSGGLP